MNNYKEEDFMPRIFPLGDRYKNLTKKQIEKLFSKHVAKNRVVKYIKFFNSIAVYYKPESEC